MNNQFEEILSRMKERMPGEISTMEGTFAGDILQATAAELARIWSQEIDTVTQRGFLSTAEGEWLDAACADYGLERKPGETDAMLRKRALERVRRRGASGNAADYQAWACEVEGVAGACAVPLGRGRGTVDVYIVPDGNAPADVQERVQTHLESLRPVGADVRVFPAQSAAVNVTASVRRTGESTLADIREEAFSAVRVYLESIGLSDDTAAVSLSRVISLLIGCRGVEDVSDVRLNGEACNLTLAGGSYARLSAVTLTEE